MGIVYWRRGDLLRRALPAVVLTLVAFAWPESGSAQDTHYWTHQYGTRGLLLGGAVIGSVADLSSTYYNPGALSLNPDPDLLLAVRVFDWTNVTATGVTAGLDIKSSSIRPAPGFFGGLLPFKFLGSSRLAYSIFTRQSFSLRVSGSQIGTSDALDELGIEDFVADVALDQNLSEVWVGLTYSHKLGRKVGLGLTQYLAVRSQRASIQETAQALNEDGESGITVIASDFEYTNWRLLWKAGLAFDLRPVSLGVTLTTPSVNLAGSGRSGVNVTVFGLDLDGDGQEDPILAADLADDLSSTFRSPLSLGLGGSLRLGRQAIHVSAEWFNKVDEFVVLDGGQFVSQSPVDTISNVVTYELDDVLNYAVGVDRSFSERVSGYLSFYTDFSGFVPGDATELSITNWDIYNLTGGSIFRAGRAELTVGLGYGWGSSKKTGLQIENPDEENRLIGEGPPSDIDYARLKFIIGFEFASGGN